MGDAIDDSTDSAEVVVRRFWATLYERDWDAIATFFDDRSHYEDVPSPDLGAVGPAAIIRRLRIGFDPVERHDHELRTIVSDGATVMVEHAETWHWPTGESATLPFVSVMEVAGGTIRRWSDYWNYDTLLGAAPEWWVTHIIEEYAREPFAGPEG